MTAAEALIQDPSERQGRFVVFQFYLCWPLHILSPIPLWSGTSKTPQSMISRCWVTGSGDIVMSDILVPSRLSWRSQQFPPVSRNDPSSTMIHLYRL